MRPLVSPRTPARDSAILEISLAPGQSKRFAVAFTRAGKLDGSARLALRLGRSVTVHGSPVTMPLLDLASSH